MIKVEINEVMGIHSAMHGMRNPLNSWKKGDTIYSEEIMCDFEGCSSFDNDTIMSGVFVGENDKALARKLVDAGPSHRKFMRQIFVSMNIKAPLYWWKEFDTYKVGTVANSCSTMHKIAEKEFTWDDFSYEHLFRVRDCKLGEPVPTLALETTINALNYWREKYLVALKTQEETGLSAKDIWWQMIQLLPSSYNQRRTIMLNYEVLNAIYYYRKLHKQDEWREFCKWIESLPYSELITCNGYEGK